MAASLDVGIRVEAVEVLSQGQGLEAAARERRYAVLAQMLATGGSLFTAHHADDQAETQLLQLLRGGGLAALAGMPAERSLGQGRLVRPLLGETREALRQCAHATSLDWVVDPDNDELSRDRNFLRHRVLPALHQRWPDATQRLSRSASDADRNLDLLRALADRYVGSENQRLPLDLLREQPAPHREWLVRRWLQCQGVAPPGRHQLADGLTALTESGGDARPVLAWADAQIRRHDDALVLLPPGNPTHFDAIEAVGPQKLTVADGSRLVFERRAAGISSNVIAAGWHLRPRQGGERIRHGGMNRSVKKLLQQAGIPEWEKMRYPLVVSGDEPIALPGILVADEARARVGWWPVWLSAWR